MPEQEITIQFVNEVKPGKKWGSIKTSEDQIFGCPPHLLNKFSVGNVYKIEFDQWKSGGMGITRIVGGPPPQSGRPIPVPQVRPATNPKDSDRMATMGMVNNFIATGQVALDADTIGRAIDICSDGLHRSKLHGRQVQSADDLNDTLPY